MLVRDVRLADAAEIVSLMNPMIEAGCYTAFTSPFTVYDEESFIQSFPARGSFLGAFHAESGEMLGFQVVTPVESSTQTSDHVGEIGTYVGLGHQRQGVAGQLHKATFERTRGSGFRKLLARVRADNEAGLRSYTRYGFETVGVVKEHVKIGERYIDEVLLERALH